MGCRALTFCRDVNSPGCTQRFEAGCRLGGLTKTPCEELARKRPHCTSTPAVQETHRVGGARGALLPKDTIVSVCARHVATWCSQSAELLADICVSTMATTGKPMMVLALLICLMLQACYSGPVQHCPTGCQIVVKGSPYCHLEEPCDTIAGRLACRISSAASNHSVAEELITDQPVKKVCTWHWSWRHPRVTCTTQCLP